MTPGTTPIAGTTATTPRRRRRTRARTAGAGIKFTTQNTAGNIGNYLAEIARDMHWLKPGLDLGSVATGFNLAMNARPGQRGVSS